MSYVCSKCGHNNSIHEQPSPKDLPKQTSFHKESLEDKTPRYIPEDWMTKTSSDLNCSKKDCLSRRHRGNLSLISNMFDLGKHEIKLTVYGYTDH